MKGLINVKFTIGKDFNTGDNVVTTTAKILNKDSINAYSKKDLGSISVKSKYPVKFETLQVLAAKKNMLAHLEDKGGMTFKECPAEYIYAKALNEDRYYHAIVVDLGTKDFPVKRTFYLTSMQELYLATFTPEYEFTETERVINDQDEQE